MGTSRPYIVVGVSGEPESVPAARWAVREAEARGLQLVIAHGVPIPYGDPPWTSEVVDAMVAGAEAVIDRRWANSSFRHTFRFAELAR